MNTSDPSYLNPRVGHMAQVASVRRLVSDDGKGRGMRVLELNNGSGLSFTVYPDRGMDIGQAYFIAPYQYQRRLISNAVRWAAAASQPPIKVSAPLCVQAAFYTQNDGRRNIVHLLNEVNTSANRAIPENNPSQREETLPIADITLSLPDAQITAAFEEPGHRPLPLKKRDTGVEVTLPRLNIHSMIVFE